MYMRHVLPGQRHVSPPCLCVACYSMLRYCVCVCVCVCVCRFMCMRHVLPRQQGPAYALHAAEM